VEESDDSPAPASHRRCSTITTSSQIPQTENSDNSLTTGGKSTQKTSVDSKFDSSRTASSEKGKGAARRPTPLAIRPSGPTVSTTGAAGGAELSPLDTISESQSCPSRPTVVTVERAAAARVYLETHFYDILSRPSLRELCRQHLALSLAQGTMTPEQQQGIWQSFAAQWTWHLRETRVLKTKSSRSARGESPGPCVDDYETLKLLGKGSFGVVKLVVEKPKPENAFRKQVFAMKVIRKTDMIRSTQEGHLRAERDLLISAEGSNWIVPLFASFQDEKNLYLVMDYMPGGDFLCLLVRENTLPENITRFYIAEMILCVEEAHRLHCIHRDVKPDNFLISPSGHLKISDFGLAFDGHWSHDTSYYNYHRYSLIHRLGITIGRAGEDGREGEKVG
jgi:protein-serine/threonine kinase